MAQVLKLELRESILRAAEALFAEAGYQGATMAQIAARAGMSTGNLYRYFANKDQLFYSIVTDEFAARFMRLLNARMKSLVQAGELTALDAKARADGEALLRF
jgi:AcrR family transcriptional regulator